MRGKQNAWLEAHRLGPKGQIFFAGFLRCFWRPEKHRKKSV
jgi:hypothetical protein